MVTISCDNTQPGATYLGKASVSITGGSGLYQIKAGYVPTYSTYVSVTTNPFVITSPTANYDGILGLRDTTGGSDKFLVQVEDSFGTIVNSASDINCTIPTTTTTTTAAPTTTTTTTAAPTTTTTTIQQVWYQLTNCSGGGTVYSTNYDIGYAAVNDRVFGTVLGVPSTLIVAVVLTSNPGGIQIGIVNSGLTGCPTTTTTTSTTTLPPVNFSLSYTCSGASSQVTASAFTGGAGTYQISTQLYTSESAAYGGVFVSITTSKTYPIGTNQQYWVALRDAVNNSNVLAKTITPNCTTTTTTTTTTTAAPTTTTTTAAPTTTTTTLPPLVISNGGVTCSGATGSFTSSFTGGTGTYTFVAIADSQANAATCVAGGACGTGGFRVTLGGGATSHNFSGIANGNWYTAVRDTLPQTSVQNTAVSVNCTTTTTAAPTTTTTTAAPTTTTTTTTAGPSCNCYTILNEGGTTGNYTYVNCSTGQTLSSNITAGATQVRCVVSGNTPTINSGFLTITNCGTPCSIQGDCSPC